MPAAKPTRSRAEIYWYGAMVIGGLAFGLLGERRPLGNDIFAHPLTLFFMVAMAGLLVLRAALARPVPEVIPERAQSDIAAAARLFRRPCHVSPRQLDRSAHPGNLALLTNA